MAETRVERMTAEGRQWVLDGAWAESLREAFLARAGAPEGLPGFRRLKENNARTVYRFGGEASGFVVKLFKAVAGVARLKERIAGSRAAQEWARLRLLRERGLPVPEAVATWTAGDGDAAGESGLVTREVAGARSLKEALAGAPPARVRELLRAAAQVAVRAHAAGVLHRDLHAGNLLLDADGGLVLIDVHRGHVGTPPGARDRLANLALLAYSLTTVLPRTGWRRLLREYLALLPTEVRAQSPLADPRRCTVVVAASVERLRARHLRHRTKRCLRDGTGFQVAELGDWRVYVQRGIDPETVLRVVRAHDARPTPAATAPPAALPAAAAVVKDTRRVKVSREVIPTLQGDTTVFVKAFRAEGIRLRMKRALGSDPGKRAWVAAHGLRVRGLPTPEALAYVEPRSRTGPLHSYLVTVAQMKASPLDKFVLAELSGATRNDGDRSRALRDRFIADLAALLRRLHRAGVYHHDLKANNVLVRRDGDVHRFELIDLDRLSFSGALSREVRMANLAQLNAATPELITRADRLRCLNAYAVGTTALGDRDEAVRRIMQLTVARRHFWPPRRGTETE